jgi:hypothetical protein
MMKRPLIPAHIMAPLTCSQVRTFYENSYSFSRDGGILGGVYREGMERVQIRRGRDGKV